MGESLPGSTCTRTLPRSFGPALESGPPLPGDQGDALQQTEPVALQYFIFRHDGHRWERVDYERLPKDIRKANLLVSPTGDDDRFAAVKRGKITVEDVKQSHRWLPSHYKEIKENAPIPLGCIARGQR